jgi:hypothetical protein
MDAKSHKQSLVTSCSASKGGLFGSSIGICTYGQVTRMAEVGWMEPPGGLELK